MTINFQRLRREWKILRTWQLPDNCLRTAWWLDKVTVISLTNLFHFKIFSPFSFINFLDFSTLLVHLVLQIWRLSQKFFHISAIRGELLFLNNSLKGLTFLLMTKKQQEKNYRLKHEAVRRVKIVEYNEIITHSSCRLGRTCSSGAKLLPLYFAPTFLGRSKQSLFLCVIAPQFSQAPFKVIIKVN